MKTIPLVIHIVYRTDEQNISDAQIQSQIEVLNQDFSRTNPDKNQTPDAFKPVAADTGIRFCLTQVIRKRTSVPLFNDSDDVKFNSTGGSTAVDVTRYMNIWVCNLGQRMLGYAEFPNTQVSNTYGVVVNYGAFGTNGTARLPYNGGRTLTHELAHCLGIYHTFSEATNPNSCLKTDHCPDIPSQSTPSKGCPSFPKLDNCAGNPPGIMFSNYMDYTNDACMNIFTKDQSDRMNAVLNIAPYNNLSKTGCKKIIQPNQGNGNNQQNQVIINNENTIQNQYTTTIKTMNKNWILAVISIIILIAIWVSKWSTKTKIWYTIAYVIIGGIIYYSIAYRKPSIT